MKVSTILVTCVGNSLTDQNSSWPEPGGRVCSNLCNCGVSIAIFQL